MPHRLSFVLFMLVSCTALAAGLDPVRVGRYSAIHSGPSPEQADPFALAIHTEFPTTVQTVRSAFEQVLAESGYRLANLTASCPSLSPLLAWPLPAVHRRLGPMRLDEALKTLAGTAHTLVVDPVHRLVSFELRAPYDGLVQTTNATAPRASDSAVASAVTEDERKREPLAPAPLAVPIPERPELQPIMVTKNSPGLHRIGPTERGAELWPIAASLREHFHATTEQVMVGIFETNPDGFCHQNLNCLKVGVYLDAPEGTQVAATKPSGARRTVQRHFEAWRQRSRRSGPVADATPKEVIP